MVAEKEMLQMSDRFRVGALLTLAGGLLDAYTYVMRGGVFANAQTGNVVLLGIRAVRGDWSGVFQRLLPIFAFAAGTIVAMAVKDHLKTKRWMHWRQGAVGLEIMVLMMVAFLPETQNSVATMGVSFVCAIQSESFRKVRGNTFATTVCTGNLRGETERLYRFLRTGQREHLERAAQYGGIIAAFIAGAALGTWCSTMLGLYTVAVACIPLLAALLMMRRES